MKKMKIQAPDPCAVPIPAAGQIWRGNLSKSLVILVSSPKGDRLGAVYLESGRLESRHSKAFIEGQYTFIADGIET